MDKDLERTIEIPEGLEVKVDVKEVIIKGNGKEVKRSFDIGRIKISVEGKEIKLKVKRATRRESKMIGTISAHLKNMIKGLQEDFEYILEVCNVHFPMNVKLEGDSVIIKSFLGETTLRKSRIMPNTKVDIKGSKITVTSHDIEAAGQTAANLEKATRLTGRDRRIFQDGIFITHKPGREI